MSLHVPVVPVTVYVTEAAGVAITEAPVVLFKPVAGLQAYVVAPLATRPVFEPEQIAEEGGVTITTGAAPTVTITVLLLVQVPFEPITVYVVVTVGVAVTVAPVLALKPAAGDQEYVTAPLAVKLVGLPEQTEAEVGLTVTVGVALTVIAMVWVELHDPFTPLTV